MFGSRAAHRCLRRLGARQQSTDELVRAHVRSALPPKYDAAFTESFWYSVWEKDGLFRPASVEGNAQTPASVNEESPTKAFSMMLPPPNVTGSLHLGHALTISIEDSLTRWL